MSDPTAYRLKLARAIYLGIKWAYQSDSIEDRILDTLATEGVVDPEALAALRELNQAANNDLRVMRAEALRLCEKNSTAEKHLSQATAKCHPGVLARAIEDALNALRSTGDSDE